MQPLKGIKILDFTTLLPGPLATLVLHDAGAEVIKIEKPGGDELRSSNPKINDVSVLFSMLNRGKKSIELDLKDSNSRNKLLPLIKSSDILIEQFRPGIMSKLGLGWNYIKSINPKIVYCSITGYGQSGSKKEFAGHDINYMAESGLLSLSKDSLGRPSIPVTQIADIGAGSYPAVMNIMFALYNSKKSGQGSYLDISMFDNLMPFAWLGLSSGFSSGIFPEDNDLHLNGSTHRYNIYKTLDNGFIALGALEDKFWFNFCDLINAPTSIRNETFIPSMLIKKIEKIIVKKNTSHWKKILSKETNICCSVVTNLSEAILQKQVIERNLFKNTLNINGVELSAIPSPIAPELIKEYSNSPIPSLGEHNHILEENKK